MADVVAALSRGHQLFAGTTVGGDMGGGLAQASLQADRISQATGSGGLPAPAAQRSGASVADLRRLGATDGALAQIMDSARADRAQASHATRVILDAAQADSMPAADTPMGRREAMLRMVARLRAQHGHVVRSRSQARALALRLRRLLYLREQQLARQGSLDAAPAGGGRGAVLAAIRRALDIKGIRNPVARARWERGMDLVAKRESGYNVGAVSHDANAAKGTPSKGVWQFIEPTFRRYHEAGTSPSIHNLVSQASAFINYAQGRYGVAADGSNLADRIQQADPRRGPRGY
jgi:SLT domain-containing protein